MMRLRYFQSALGTTAAMLVICSGLNRTVAGAFSTLTAGNAKLWLTTSDHKTTAGVPAFLTAHLHNLGRVPIYIPRGIGPLQYFKVNARYLGGHGHVPWLREGIIGQEMNIHRLISALVQPGQSIRLWRKVEINRYLDMSMPGLYKIRFAVGHLESNWLKFMVRPPEVQLPVGKILRPSSENWPQHGGKKQNAIQLRISGFTFAGKTQAEGVWVFLRGGGRNGKNVELTGNRLVDLAAIQVEGPDGYNGDELVKKPKPHYIPMPNHQQVPFTAYGKWLLTHAPKALQEKRFTLKPGVVYKYAVPINLSCQFDMSLSGVYRVRIELAHPRVWSNWARLTVP